MGLIDVVNENDEIVRQASKDEIYEKKLLHRIVHVFIFNEKGEMALQLQSKYKKFCPQHWVTAAAGHVKAGESEEEAAVRELEEETGIKTNIDFLYKDFFDVSSNFRKILITFKSGFNGPFKINPMEVEKIEFFTIDKIKEMIKSGEKFHPEFLFLLKKHFNI